jgi:hypothetical protein
MRRCLAFVSLVVALAAIAFAANQPTTLWGCWIVKRALPTTNIAALSQKEVDLIIGTRLVYSSSCVQSRRTILKSPKFITTVLSEPEFFQLAYIPLKQLGIAGSTATMVTVSGAEDRGSAFVGDTVFLGGKSPVIEFQGVFFELEKTRSDKSNCTSSTSKTSSNSKPRGRAGGPPL